MDCNSLFTSIAPFALRPGSGRTDKEKPFVVSVSNHERCMLFVCYNLLVCDFDSNDSCAHAAALVCYEIDKVVYVFAHTGGRNVFNL